MSLFSNDEDPIKEDLLRELFGELPFGSSSVVSEAGIATAAENAASSALSNYLAQFEGRTPLDIMELTPGEGQQPTDFEDVETIFDILMDVMAGTQGNVAGLDEETIDTLLTAIEGSSSEELLVIAQEIQAAGGFQQWLSQQRRGDPGGGEPDGGEGDEEEEETPQQETVSLEEFETQFPDVEITNEIFESGTWTDPETGIVYVINFPPDFNPDQLPGGGDGGGGGGDTGGDTGSGNEGDEDPAGSFATFKVENGVVYVWDYETGEWVLADEFDPRPGWWHGYLGENPEDGLYNDNGTPIDTEEDITPVSKECPPGFTYNDLFGACMPDTTIIIDDPDGGDDGDDTDDGTDDDDDTDGDDDDDTDGDTDGDEGDDTEGDDTEGDNTEGDEDDDTEGEGGPGEGGPGEGGPGTGIGTGLLASTTPTFPKAQPFMTNIDYVSPQLQPLILPQPIQPMRLPSANDLAAGMLTNMFLNRKKV